MLQSTGSEIHLISKFERVLATLSDPPTQKQIIVLVNRLSACSRRLRAEFETPPSVPISHSVSRSSLHCSMQYERTRGVNSVDLATQPRGIVKSVHKSTRPDNYVYLMYEYREMD